MYTHANFIHTQVHVHISFNISGKCFLCFKGKKREKEYDDYNKNNSINQIILNTFPRKP